MSNNPDGRNAFRGGIFHDRDSEYEIAMANWEATKDAFRREPVVRPAPRWNPDSAYWGSAESERAYTPPAHRIVFNSNLAVDLWHNSHEKYEFVPPTQPTHAGRDRTLREHQPDISRIVHKEKYDEAAEAYDVDAIPYNGGDSGEGRDSGHAT